MIKSFQDNGVQEVSESIATVGTWNAKNMFGQENWQDAVEVVKKMDADILFLGETTKLEDRDSEYYQNAELALRAQGYWGALTGYYPPYPNDVTEAQKRYERRERPNQHTMSMWTRIGETAVDEVVRHPFGNRYGMEFYHRESGLRVLGVHPDDLHPALRIDYVQDALSYLAHVPRIDIASDTLQPTILMGDFNETHGSFTLKALNLLLRRIPIEHHNPKAGKLQKLASYASRVSAMGLGHSLALLEMAGFEEADTQHQPTVGLGPIKLQIDHIFGKNVVLENFQRYEESRGKYHSDHVGLTAVTARAQAA